MSRMAVLLILAESSTSAQPRQVTAEEGMEIHRRTFALAPEKKCPTAENPDEIVVCGRVARDYRVPYAPELGDRVPGEGPGEAAFGCLRMCSESVDLKKMAVTAFKVVRKILNPDR